MLKTKSGAWNAPLNTHTHTRKGESMQRQRKKEKGNKRSKWNGVEVNEKSAPSSSFGSHAEESGGEKTTRTLKKKGVEARKRTEDMVQGGGKMKWWIEQGSIRRKRENENKRKAHIRDNIDVSLTNEVASAKNTEKKKCIDFFLGLPLNLSQPHSFSPSFRSFRRNVTFFFLRLLPAFV